MTSTPYAHPAHLSAEDTELRNYADQSWARQIQMASRDIELDLERRGLCASTVWSTGAHAVSRVSLMSLSDEAVRVPEGTRLFAVHGSCNSQWSRLHFITDVEVSLPPAGMEDVDVSAVHWGVPWNIDAGSLLYVEAAELAENLSLSHHVPGIFGTDHPLTRATVYRALELVYGDLSRGDDDMFNHKRRIYAKRYTEEVTRLQQAGLRTGRSDTAGGRSYGAVRLIRG